MAALSLLVLAFCSATVVSASPRNHIARGQGGNASPGGKSGPPGYSDGGSWDSKTDDWGGPSQYGGSWGHSSTVDYPGSQYGGGGGGGWGHGTTCAVSTVTEVSTSQVAGPTIYISGSGYTTTLSASTIHISGSDHTSYIPASTVTIQGPVQTSISTSFGTVTQPAAPTTVYITQNGPGWNRTVTHEETEILTTTQREISTIYNEETTTATSLVTLPGTTATFYETSTRDLTVTSVYTVPAPASTVYQSITITSNFVTTWTSTIAPSTVTSYEVSTAPGATVTSYSTIPAGPASTIVITQTQPAATIVLTAYVTTPITSVSTYTQISTLIEAPSIITKFSTLPGLTEIVYSTVRSAYTSTIVSVQPGRTIYETFVSTEKGATVTSYSFPVGPVSQPSTTTPSCSIPIGPESLPATVTQTSTLPGITFTSFLTAPGFNHSSVYTSFITQQGPTFVSTAPGVRTTITEQKTRTIPGPTFTAPGGSFTYTQYATKTLPGSTITSIIYQPGENSTITNTETTTCYETVSTCSASPTGPASPPREITIYAMDYITKTIPGIPTTYTADATCHDVTITLTASSSDWDKPDGYGSQTWDDIKPSQYGGAAATSSGYWRRL
ncbi:hypothetical protein MBLNU13_g11472t2 [Cladosporium sp. NU13]